MFTVINALSSSIVVELARIITGRIFDEKHIRNITKTAVGKYFADLFPEPEDERTARERVEEARQYIEKAAFIINQMQKELSDQSTHLDNLLAEIEQKRDLAEKYSHLAATNKQQFSALRTEIEDVLRNELIMQAEKGRRLRQFASVVIWLLTLVLGAGLGAYFKEILAWAIR